MGDYSPNRDIIRLNPEGNAKNALGVAAKATTTTATITRNNAKDGDDGTCVRNDG